MWRQKEQTQKEEKYMDTPKDTNNNAYIWQRIRATLQMKTNEEQISSIKTLRLISEIKKNNEIL